MQGGAEIWRWVVVSRGPGGGGGVVVFPWPGGGVVVALPWRRGGGVRGIPMVLGGLLCPWEYHDPGPLV